MTTATAVRSEFAGVEPTALRQIDAALNAANGIQRVRSLILGLALSGKLVGQLSADGTGGSLVAQLGGTRDALLKCKRVSRRGYDDVQAPADSVPASWGWARLGDIVRDCGQGVPSNRFTYIDVGSIDNKKGSILAAELAVIEPSDAPSRARKAVEIGSVIYSTVRPYLLNIAVIDSLPSPAPIVSTAFAVLHPLDGVEPRFLFHVLRSPFFVSYVEGQMAGIAYPAINDRKLYSAWVPLPPTEEQKRIVAKVDQLMSLCDELEAKETEKREVGDRLTKAAFAALTSAETPEEFKVAWKRVSESFGALVDGKQQVSAVRTAIVDLALRGLLVPQKCSEGSGHELLLALAGRAVAPVEDDRIERPFDLPTNWAWGTLGAVCSDVHYGFTASADKTRRDVLLLRITDIQDDAVDWSTVPGCSIEKGEVGKYRLGEGDLLIARTGGTIGKTFIVPSQPPTAVFASYLIRAIPVAPMHPPFLKAFSRSSLYWRQLIAGSAGTGQPNVNATTLKTLRIPIPPVDEQKRIVAKLDQLMALCDELEADLVSRDVKAEQLAETLVASAATPFTGP